MCVKWNILFSLLSFRELNINLHILFLLSLCSLYLQNFILFLKKILIFNHLQRLFLFLLICLINSMLLVFKVSLNYLNLDYGFVLVFLLLLVSSLYCLIAILCSPIHYLLFIFILMQCIFILYIAFCIAIYYLNFSCRTLKKSAVCSSIRA